MDQERQALLQRSKKRAGGTCFVFIIHFVIAIIYTAYCAVIQLPDIINSDSHERWALIAASAAFHTAFILFLASIYAAMRTEPGAVPIHWAFMVGEQSRRRRYCRVCDVWKPDRTHHCSQCGRCVLNMDHHCPWINNCVGFFNRKFFVQTLIYANIALAILLVHSVVHLGDSAMEFSHHQLAGPVDYIDWGATICLISLSSILMAGLIPFTRFHWHLLVMNSTTIESMDAAIDDNRFDLGPLRNLQQVFGTNFWMWWLPAHTSSSQPLGDGVRWRRHYLANEQV